jgi:hypothetical protein
MNTNQIVSGIKNWSDSSLIDSHPSNNSVSISGQTMSPLRQGEQSSFKPSQQDIDRICRDLGSNDQPRRITVTNQI